MKDMFFNYDNKLYNTVNHSHQHCQYDNILKSSPAVSLVTNIKGDVLGIQVKYANPFSLYFTLNDFGTAYFATEKSLIDLVMESDIQLELTTFSGKTIFTKHYSPEEVFDIFTNSLRLDFTHEETKNFKRESYKLSVKLCWDNSFYELFTPADGLLIVR